MQNHTQKDLLWMRKALFLAWLKKGTTSPNPTVGAILVSENGEILGSGVTQPNGEHAEQNLFRLIEEKEKKIDFQKTTLYLTLEPCCIREHGIPCVKLIIERKIKRVVIGVLDFNPQIKNKGVNLLKEHSIDVTLGVLEPLATEINEDFFLAVNAQRSFVFAKYAASLDGFITTKAGRTERISDQSSENLLHLLRYRSDAILVGAQTVIADNPKLTVRLKNREKEILRVVLDRSAETPLDSHILTDSKKTLVVVGASFANEQWVKKISCIKNKEVFIMGQEQNLEDLLRYLYKEKKVLSLMLEGGTGVLSSFLSERLIDKAFIFLNPRLFGKGLSPFANFFLPSALKAPILSNLKVKKLKKDILLYGKIEWPKIN
jgi:diaminohydroxyphosphoribosylaminopyrimidine deaminase/5-amino-6-(5-phosphoribosylamino)uracil reductase